MQKSESKEKETTNKPTNLKRKISEISNPKASKSNIEQPSELNKWWNEPIVAGDEEIKWDYLEHNGVLFPPFYKPHKVRINHKGEAIALNKPEEELATYWSQTIGSEWERKPIYRTNFSMTFMELLNKSHPEIKNFDDLDFDPIVKYLGEQREIKKNRGPDEKKVYLKFSYIL